MTTYRTDKPPVNVAVIVWWWGDAKGEVVATWDGAWWRDEQGRKLREPVTHWREK